jgi:quinol monooxygenase YgiN
MRIDFTRSLIPACAALVLALAAAGAFTTAAPAQSGGQVYAVTYLDVAADWVLQGSGLLKEYRDQARRAPGNIEFTVLRETTRPNRFAIVEGWADQAAFDAHEKSADKRQFEFILGAIRNSPPNQHVLRAFATAPAHGQATADAVRMVEHVDFQPPANAASEPKLKALAEASQKGAGVVRYDVYQEPVPHTNHYSVVAVWANRQAFDSYQTAAATRDFRAGTMLPARANLYDQRLYQLLD